MNNLVKSECKFLRTKKSYIPNIDDPESWRTNKSSTSQYWCTKTMLVTGPDGKLVEPEGCLNHRSCYLSMSEIS